MSESIIWIVQLDHQERRVGEEQKYNRVWIIHKEDNDDFEGDFNIPDRLHNWTQDVEIEWSISLLEINMWETAFLRKVATKFQKETIAGGIDENRFKKEFSHF